MLEDLPERGEICLGPRIRIVIGAIVVGAAGASPAKHCGLGVRKLAQNNLENGERDDVRRVNNCTAGVLVEGCSDSASALF